MYGGHITDDWDRILCKTYLVVYMDQEQVSRIGSWLGFLYHTIMANRQVKRDIFVDLVNVVSA